ncbi:hypothetical protein K470DRAFT_134530 [Piedraia hortae CBS 480.64]|uniref:Uncharacterized protein n=1 Tax=Piedraia hortae CBS 480.64 TaxID=1314780 RepID=A0A6A7BUA5_9PEZI|nr:hypothetical protein K470DRAFT_134530 [Piedraia hortae CBS 480.64]
MSTPPMETIEIHYIKALFTQHHYRECIQTCFTVLKSSHHPLQSKLLIEIFLALSHDELGRSGSGTTAEKVKMFETAEGYYRGALGKIEEVERGCAWGVGTGGAAGGVEAGGASQMRSVSALAALPPSSSSSSSASGLTSHSGPGFASGFGFPSASTPRTPLSSAKRISSSNFNGTGHAVSSIPIRTSTPRTRSNTIQSEFKLTVRVEARAGLFGERVRRPVPAIGEREVGREASPSPGQAVHVAKNKALRGNGTMVSQPKETSTSAEVGRDPSQSMRDGSPPSSEVGRDEASQASRESSPQSTTKTPQDSSPTPPNDVATSTPLPNPKLPAKLHALKKQVERHLDLLLLAKSHLEGASSPLGKEKRIQDGRARNWTRERFRPERFQRLAGGIA